MEITNQGQRCFFSNARYSRNVVRTVPHQRLYINQLLGQNRVFFQNGRHIVQRGFRPSHFGGSQPHLHLLCDQLQCVPVAGGDHALPALLLTGAAEGAEDVVRLIPFALHHRITQVRQQFLEHRKLPRQLRRHALSPGFVAVELLMTESGPLFVKSHRHPVRHCLLQHPEQNTQKAIDAVGVNSSLGRQKLYPVKSAV